MTRAERAQTYFDFLAEEGFRPTLDEDGDVVFKVEGYMYYVSIEEDEQFFRLIFPNFWPLENRAERERAERAALAVTSHLKVVKVLPTERGVLATVEMFCAPPESVLPVFHRAIQAIQGAVRAFMEEMRTTST
jgi:hypothetical protein